MFSEFEDIFKKVKPAINSNDYSKTPQKFTINGRDIIEKKLLSEGAFGFIWLAEDIQTKQEFALKRVICMTEDSLKAAMTEKQIYEKLPASPHIVGYYGGKVFKHGDRTIVVILMQLCPNGNLFDMLQKYEGKGLSEQAIMKMADSVLKGLVLLHQAGFIHRDIKIENVLVGKDLQMKICDFGSCTNQIVDFAKVHKDNYQIQQEKIECYTTPMYRPPQVVDPYLRYSVTNKVDLWMLGCVLYTMSYFTHPFLDSNAVGIASGVFRFPEYPAQTKYKVSPKVQDFIRNLLTPNPNSRPSAAKMLEIVNRWAEYEKIPLNAEARKLKEEHLKKQEEMRKLSKKAVQHDGDIPIEQLMNLKNKIIKDTAQQEIQGKSFITKNKKQKASKLGSLKSTNAQPDASTNAQHSLSNSAQLGPSKQTSKASPQKAQKPSSSNIEFDPWTLCPVRKQSKSDKNFNFSEFDDHINTANPKPKPPNQSTPASNNNFMQFFSETNQTSSNTMSAITLPSKVDKKSSKTEDLLDL